MHLHITARRLWARRTLAQGTWLMLALVACVGSPKTTGGQTLSGKVVDTTGKPVAAARVVAGANLAQATTDASGRYALSIKAADVTGGALAVTADNYAPMSRQLTLAATQQDFVLRPFDAVVPIVLPTGSEPSVQASVSRGDGNVTLSIPADAMVTQAGLAASGNAEVRLTYWNPAQDLNNTPGSLAARVGSNSNVVLALQSLGMVDVQVVQAGEQLQVAKGKSLQLDQKLPPVFQAAMAQRPTGVHDPFMFYLDHTAGVWVLDGSLAYDKANGVLQGTLPHLTTWNYDLFQNWNPPTNCTADDILNSRGECAKPENTDLGGCMAGRALQQDGSPLANQTVRLWLFDFEHTSAVDLQTDASGRYCLSVGIRMCVPWGNDAGCKYTENSIYYHVSSPKSPDMSSMKNPLPTSCSTQSGAYSYANYNTVQYFNDCALVDDDGSGKTRNTTPANPVASVNITACSYCDGKGPGYCGVQGAQLSNKCAPIPDVTMAPACPVLLKVGQSCTGVLAPCCPQGTVCSDEVCVPVLQGTAGSK